MMRTLYFTLGWILFCLGFIGAFIPVLPTTPLMLLALWCFSRSSERFHQWLYTHRLFGPPLQQWDQHRVIPLGAKCIAVFFMAGSLVYLVVYRDAPVWAEALMTAVMAYGAWFVLSKPSAPREK